MSDPHSNGPSFPDFQEETVTAAQSKSAISFLNSGVWVSDLPKEARHLQFLNLYLEEALSRYQKDVSLFCFFFVTQESPVTPARRFKRTRLMPYTITPRQATAGKSRITKKYPLIPVSDEMGKLRHVKFSPRGTNK